MKKLLMAFMAAILCMGLGACGTQKSEETTPPKQTKQPAVQAKKMSGEELTALLKDDEGMKEILLLDVRDETDFASGHIEGAQNIFVNELESRLSEIESYKDKQVVLYCNTGNKSGKAAKILLKNGFTNVYDAEGVKQFEYELLR